MSIATPQSLTRVVRNMHQDERIDQARRIAEAKNAREGRLSEADDPWTVERVLIIALCNGLDELSRRYSA